MIYSMTAFAHTEIDHEMGHFTCDLRSFNHRYLEVSVHVSERLVALEAAIRDCIRQHLARGKVECKLYYQPNLETNPSSFSVNKPLVKTLCQMSEEIGAALKQSAPVSPADIWNFPGVLISSEQDMSELKTISLKLLEKTLKELIATRRREGGALEAVFLNKVEAIASALALVKKRYPVILQDRAVRLKQRFAELQLSIDPNRLEQEIVLFAQKVDIAEEIERIEMHLSEMRRVLKAEGVAGRRLDFLLQELNREANTLGSKSVDAEITHQAVEIKVLLEQVREQVQNVE